jgi:hypothetical protein
VQEGWRRSWPGVLDRLAQEAGALGTDPGFADEMNRVAHLLAIPLPEAIVSARTRAAVARRCSELAGEGDTRHAAALLAGYLLAVVRWERAPRPGPGQS